MEFTVEEANRIYALIKYNLYSSNGVSAKAAAVNSMDLMDLIEAGIYPNNYKEDFGTKKELVTWLKSVK